MKNKKAIFFLLLATCVVFINGLFSGFVWDDQKLVIAKQDFFGHPESAITILASSDASLGKTNPYYRPLNTLTYMLDHYLWGLHPFWYHLENVLLHALAVALLYLLLVEVFEDRWTAFFSAVLFAVYPVNAESVDLITARNTLLCGVFSIASLLSLKKGGLKWALTALLFYFLALMSKEPAVILPFFLLSFSITANQEKLKPRKGVLAGYFAVTAFYFLLRHFILGAFTSAEGASLSPDRLKFISSVLFENFKLMVFPFSLNAWRTVSEMTFSAPKAVAAAIAACLLLYLSVARRTSGPVRAGAQWVLWGLLPVSNIVAIPSAPVAERFQYTFISGFLLIIGYSLARLQKKYLKAGITVMAVLVTALGAMTFERNFVWRDNMSLYSSMVKSDPENSLALYDLGVEYKERGDLAAAARQFESVLAIDPGHIKALVFLGIVYSEEGRFAEAVKEFRTAISLSPGYAKAHLNLGLAYAKTGRLDDAAGEFMTSARLEPDSPEAHFFLGMSFEKMGRFADAAREFRKVGELAPGNEKALENLKYAESRAEGGLRKK